MPTTCLAALIKRLRGIWEWYRLRTEAAHNRRDDGHGRGVARGQDIQETHPAQGHRKEHRETWGAHRQQGHRAGGDRPVHREYDRTKTEKDRFGQREQRLYGEGMQSCKEKCNSHTLTTKRMAIK